MENGIPNAHYPFLSRWDVNKYQYKFPPEHWDLCKLFMEAHKTKYGEARLVQLTEAFYNLGVGGFTDPKTERLVTTLSVPVINHFLYLHPDRIRHPFRRQTQEDEADSGSIIQIESGAEDHTAETESGSGSSVKPSNSLEGKRHPLEGNAGSSWSSQGSSRGGTHSSSENQHSAKPKQNISSLKRSSTELKTEFDQKQKRFTPRNDTTSISTAGFKLDKEYKLKYLMGLSRLKTLLRAFVIIRGVTSRSTLNNDIAVIEESFKRSRFGPCTWHITKIEESQDIVRIILNLGKDVLMVAEGRNKEFVQLQMSQAFLTRVKQFSPIIQASQSYYNDGESRTLPTESRGFCKLYLNHYTLDSLKELIDSYAQKQDFSEMIVLHHGQNSNEFNIEDIMEFIDKERADKLSYRLAIYSYEGKNHPAICVSQIHNGVDLAHWLRNCLNDRYSLIFKVNLRKKQNVQNFWRYSRMFPTDNKEVPDIASDYRKEGNSSGKTKKDDANTKTGAPNDQPRIKHDLLDSKSNTVRSSKENEVSNKPGLSQSKNSLKNDQSKQNSTSRGPGTKPCLPRRANDKIVVTRRLLERLENAETKEFLSQRQDSRWRVRLESGAITRLRPHQLRELLKEQGLNQPLTVKSSEKNVTPLSKPLVQVKLPIGPQRQDKLEWVGREHLAELGKSIYLVKFVKDDSTTETDPFKLLNSVCSVAFTVELKFVMKHNEHKQWQVSVVLKHDSGNILVGEATDAVCADARLAAARDAVNTIQASCKIVEPNFNYFAEGGVPSFISLKNPLKTSTYEIMVINTSKAAQLTPKFVDLMLEMFIGDNDPEDLFFLASDYSSEERECIRQAAVKYKLQWRLLGQRSRTATADDVVANQHLCVYRPKSALDLVQQLITCGGSTDKYSIVTKHLTSENQALESPAEQEPPVLRKPPPREGFCPCENLPGGCWHTTCSFAHLNILDNITNQFLGAR